MMSDWRQAAKRGDWKNIEVSHLLPGERQELMFLLEQTLPKREHGDGIITFKDNIRPENAQSIADHDGALLLIHLRRMDQPAKSLDPFGHDAIEHAVGILERTGLKFEGLHDTYIYEAKGVGVLNGRWRQLPRGIGRSLFEKRMTLLADRSESGTTTFERWIRRYEWRRSMTLHEAFHFFEKFEPFTQEWHALKILHAEQFLPSDERDGPSRSAFHFAMQSASSIEASYQALIFKSHFESDTLRGRKTLKSAIDGGKARFGKHAKSTDAVLSAMAELLQKRPSLSISGAAEVAKKKGIGKSAESNRSLWYYHRKKKL